MQSCPCSDVIVCLVLHDLLAHASAVLDAKVIRFTLDELLGSVAAGLEMEFIRRDPGDRDWNPDKEAKQPQTDSWAAFHVSVRKQAKSPSGAASPSSRASQASSYAFHQVPIQRPQPYPLTWGIEPPDPELDRLRELKAWETQQKKADAEKARIHQQQRDAEAKRLERMANDLRRSQFTYDYDGKILLMKQRPLPDVPHVEFTITGDKEETAVKTTAVSPRPLQAVKKTPTAEVLFVKSLNAVPTMMDLLKLNPGVTAIESTRSKRGPDSTQKTMSRDDYRRLTGEEVLTSTQSPITKSPRLRRKLLADIPDSDHEDDSSMAHYKSAPSLPLSSLSEVDKFNLEILRADDWGKNVGSSSPRNFPPIPEKPNGKISHATHGLIARRPRERPYVARKANKEHLPPPRIGKTMGHGMVEPQYAK